VGNGKDPSGGEPDKEPDDKACAKPPLRLEYEAKVKALQDKVKQMRAEGKSSEEIARAVHAERRALGVQYKDLTPPDLLDSIYKRNLGKYGDKLGPTVEWLRDRGKSWEDIIESATRPGGADLFGPRAKL